MTLRLQPVESGWMVGETARVAGLAAMLYGLRDAAKDWQYTVGWIDCLARGAALGRGILMRGRHAGRGEAPASPPPDPRRLAVPMNAPEWLLCPLLMRAFNTAYYRSHARHPGGSARIVPYHGFFYPLDAIGNWNRLYGRRGFLQYQCVVPRAADVAPAASRSRSSATAAPAARGTTHWYWRKPRRP